jgi:hypothetical protein
MAPDIFTPSMPHRPGRFSVTPAAVNISLTRSSVAAYTPPAVGSGVVPRVRQREGWFLQDFESAIFYEADLQPT